MNHCKVGLSLVCLAAVLLPGVVAAAPVSTTDGLSGEAAGARLSGLRAGGRAMAGVSIEVAVEEPRTGKPAGGDFQVAGAWRSGKGYLALTGEVRASGREDRAADLVVRVRGAELALSSMAEDPLLLPRKLLSRLPLVSLRVAGEDSLALAIPPDRLAIYEFRQVPGAVELRYPFGFTQDARPELRMRGPFTCVLYRTEPRWHFRSALARYYRFFPEPFRPFTRAGGGWFFAAETKDLPNPQHFAFHEGGPGGWEEDDARGMGTYPYRESSSYTISLPGATPPKGYDEAVAQFEALDKIRTPAGWTPQQAMSLDTAAKHSGERSLLADSGPTGRWTGALQTIELPKAVSEPITVKGFSRCEGLSGDRDHSYAVYVDVTYTDGSYLFGQCATFSTGTHDWEAGEYTIRPEKPVDTLRVFCLLRGHQGRAWFDDIQVGPAAQPEVNWVRNPGFEQDAKRQDLQYIRDNACANAAGGMAFHITDNLSADVGPAQPMNLLRFSLNVDPDVPSTPERPAVAAREFEYYDGVFRAAKGVDGCYIDSVSAWCAGLLNFRRDHWRYNDFPFTYDPASLKVAPHGRFAMYEYLRALQHRYHPGGKSVFTNIHCELRSFPLYLASDIPGIESSQFQDQDCLFFYRASSYHKPLLLMNFINLHGLDRREVAVTFHRNAAQWGHFPSTGRFVQRAYQEYGDVTHAYLPAIQELAEAGWQPVPLAEGARVERFGEGVPVYFTVRAPKEAAEETLVPLPEALARVGAAPVAFDAVRLAELPLRRQGAGWSLPLAHGGEEVTIVRIDTRAGTERWLVERARRHVVNATRVQGKVSAAPELLALAKSLSLPAGGSRPAALLSAWQAKLDAALAGVGQGSDLFSVSRRRELQQARDALGALAVLTSGSKLGIAGPRLSTPGHAVELAADSSVAGGMAARLVGFEAVPDETPMPGSLAPSAPAGTSGRLRVESARPQAFTARALFECGVPGGRPWRVERWARLFFLPGASLGIREQTANGEMRSFAVSISRSDPARKLFLRVSATPEAPLQAGPMALAAGQSAATVQVGRVLDGALRTLVVAAADEAGNELARAETSYWDEAPVPEGDLALARRSARCSTDSCYDGYSPAPLIDGIVSPSGLHWTQQAWASADSSLPHWIQVDLPEPATVREARIYWALDGGRMHTSGRYTLVGVTEGGRQSLARCDGQPSCSMTRHTFAPVRLRSFRIEQDADGGPAFRPGILWAREVCLLP